MRSNEVLQIFLATAKKGNSLGVFYHLNPKELINESIDLY